MAEPGCPSCSRPLPVHLAEDGQVRCTFCGAVSAVGDDLFDSSLGVEATLDVPPPRVAAVEPLPAGYSVPFSPDFLEQYQPLGFLGRGAMGAVYLMRQVKLDRLVAVKVVREDVMTADEARRLEREARTLAKLNHPNILGIYDIGRDGGVPYMVCEYVEGETLAKRLARRPGLTLAASLRVASYVLDGLRAAHKKGIVHRDLKPGNIFLGAALKPKIGDFGLAKAQTVSSGTLVGKILGTPAYMSPEQCRGSQTTQASDLYAVGVILFEMAAGKRPFPGPETLDYLTQHTTNPAPAIRQVNPGVPPELEKILLKSMSKDPARRFDSARSFRKELLDLLKSLAPAADSAPAKPPAKPPGRPLVELGAGALLASRYRVLRQLGEGGMGQVWLASDEAMDGTEVALKILPPDLWKDDEARETLRQEAKLSQKLAHPNIVRLMTLEPGEPSFLVMEFVSGPTLAAELAARKRTNLGAFTPQEALPILEGIAAGLDHAHGKQLVHRDLKPSNVLLEPGPGNTWTAKLADFGIAAEVTSYRTRQTGAVPAGTLAYMSPEQLACQKLDGRADVYSLGATLYQMLTLRPPYVGGDIAWAIRNEPVPEPTGVAGPVTQVVVEALAKRPEDRPPSAGALAARFRQACARLGAAEERPPDSGRRDMPATDPGRRDTGPARAHRLLSTELVPPWPIEAYAAALALSAGLLVIWFHAGWLVEDRLTPPRALFQGAAALALPVLIAYALWTGRNLARQALWLLHALLIPLAVVTVYRGHLDLFYAEMLIGIAGVWLLEQPAARAYCTRRRTDGIDLRAHHRRGLALALALPLVWAALFATRLHVQRLAPQAIPASVWRQDLTDLMPPATTKDGTITVELPQGWTPVAEMGASELGFVCLSGPNFRVGAITFRRLVRRASPGDIGAARDRIRRYRHRFHFEPERAGLLPAGERTWIEVLGRYATRAGPRASWYAETSKGGHAYEVELYGLPSFVAANRPVMASLLARMKLAAP